MPSTLTLLERALDLKPSPEWTALLGIHRNALHTAKIAGHLPPVIAGNLAIELGEDPAPWMMQAVIEGAKDSPAKQRLAKRLAARVRSYFNDSDATWRPYAGIGGTYVFYRSVELSQSLQGALASQIGAPAALARTTADLKSSFAPVFNVGMAYKLDKNWGLAFSVSYIPLKTKATLTTSVAGRNVATSETRLKLNPIVSYVGLTYTF